MYKLLAVIASSLSLRSALAASALPVPLCNGVDIEDATVGQLQQLLSAGTLSSQDLVHCYTARIEATNGHLRSVSEINPDAVAIAEAMDAERAGNSTRGPFHGIPFLVKDNIYTDDKHNTSEGTLVLLGGRYSSEATVVQKIREAGGVLLGHASMDEAADHRALFNYSGGYSSRTGQVRNPFNMTQLTSGSSSGSVVAVASNQIPIALGSETHGSLVHPAANQGLYTLKSTPGLMSRHGIVTGSFYHDTPGALGRSIADIAVMLDIMAGYDPLDNLTADAVGRYPAGGYEAEVVGKEALRGMKLGVPWNPYWSTMAAMNAPGLRDLYEGRLQELKDAGAEIFNVTMPGIEEIASSYGFGQPSTTPAYFDQLIAYYTLLAVGYGEFLQNWTFPRNDSRYGMSSLTEMAAWNIANNASTGALGNNTKWWHTVSGQDFYDSAIATEGKLNATFWGAFGFGRNTARRAIDGGHVHMLENGTTILLDGLLVPNNHAGGFDNPCASIPSYAGYPIASVPMGQSGYDVPTGICIYGQQWGEAKLIRVASAMEDLFQWQATPLYHNIEVEQGRADAPWPGYACSMESLEQYACDES